MNKHLKDRMKTLENESFFLIQSDDLDLDFLETDGFSPNRRLNGPFQFFLTTNHIQPDSSKKDGADYIITTCAPGILLYSASYKQDLPDTFYHPVLHRHDYYELMIVLEGELYQNIENIRHYYPAGSGCILNPNVRHTEEFITDCRCVYVQMSAELIRQCFDVPPLFSAEPDDLMLEMRSFFFPSGISETSQQKTYIDFIAEEGSTAARTRLKTRNLLDSMIQETMSPSLNASSRIRCGLTELFYHLFSKDRYSRTPVRLGTDQEAQLFHEIREIMQASHGMISRSDLEAKYHYSGNYIYKIVRKYTGQSIVDFAISFRLKEAARLLLQSDENIEDIALQLGFHNRTHFYRLFRKTYGETPLQYRKTAKVKDS